jgi:DivIVA domain-containing protein
VTLLFTLLTLAVLGVIAAVASGKIAGGLEEPSTSLPARGLPEGPVTPESLGAVRFSPALRGYRMQEVDVVLDQLGAELARRDRDILQLSQELRLAERTYLRQAARAAANPEWSAPDTGPYQSESYQSESYQSEPYQSEPYQSEPYQSEPYQSEPYQSEPYQSGPYQSEPYQSEPSDAGQHGGATYSYREHQDRFGRRGGDHARPGREEIAGPGAGPAPGQH